MTFRHVFPLELVLICVFPACTHPRCGCRFPSGCVSPAPPLTAKPGGGASFLRPAHHPASSRFRHTHTASSSLSRTPPPTPSCSRRCLHPPSSGCASARPALLSRRPDGKRGALCGAGGWCVFTNRMRWCFLWYSSSAAWNRCMAFGRAHGEWSVYGTTGSSWMDEWMVGSRMYSELLKRWRGWAERKMRGGWRTGATGLPSLCLSSWWPVAGWGRIYNKQQQHKANWDLNDPKIISCPRR